MDEKDLKKMPLEDLKALQTKELNNGRLAMIAVAGEQRTSCCTTNLCST